MVTRKNKKGTIEMSLNLIIMLIIGMVILGLVIGFVNSLVKKGTSSFDKQLGDNEKLKLEDVKSCAENLCVNPYPSITIKKGGKTNIFIKVRSFGDAISCSPGDLSNCDAVKYNIAASDGTDVTSDSSLILSGPGFNAKNGKDDAEMYTLNTGSSIKVGTYYLTLKLYPGTANEKSKTINVNVN